MRKQMNALTSRERSRIRPYCNMSHCRKKSCSAGVRGGTSGFAKLCLGTPSVVVATAKSSRSLRLRDSTIELSRVSTTKLISSESDECALSSGGVLTCILAASGARASCGRRARPQSWHRRQRHPFCMKTDGPPGFSRVRWMENDVLPDGKGGVGAWLIEVGCVASACGRRDEDAVAIFRGRAGAGRDYLEGLAALYALVAQVSRGRSRGGRAGPRVPWWCCAASKGRPRLGGCNLAGDASGAFGCVERLFLQARCHYRSHVRSVLAPA